MNDGGSNGIIYTTANTPTSILGAFLGGDASPRLIQLKGTFVFYNPTQKAERAYAPMEALRLSAFESK